GVEDRLRHSLPPARGIRLRRPGVEPGRLRGAWAARWHPATPPQGGLARRQTVELLADLGQRLGGDTGLGELLVDALDHVLGPDALLRCELERYLRGSHRHAQQLLGRDLADVEVVEHAERL